MLRMSGLLGQLEQHSHSPTGEPLCIYGDPAYPHRIWLQTPYRDVNLSDEQQEFNASMSAVRVAVFKNFAFIDYKKNLKIGLSPLGKMYAVSALLRNALTCLYGNYTSMFFDITPPTLQEYFQI